MRKSKINKRRPLSPQHLLI